MSDRMTYKRIQEKLIDFQERISRETPPFKDSSREAIKQRWEQTKADTTAFMNTYMTHYVDSPEATFHHDLDAMMEWPQRCVFPVHGPREHAKSTRVGRIKFLQMLLSGRIKYWLFGSEKLSLAWDHIEYLHTELLFNPRINADFEVLTVNKNSQQGKLRLKITNKATGQRVQCMLQAVSYETSAKGLLFLQHRPQGAIIDDFENTRSSRNRRIGQEKVDWVMQELYPAVTGPVLWLGNIGHDNSALHQAWEEAFDHPDDLQAFKESGTLPGTFRQQSGTGAGNVPAEGQADSGIVPVNFRAEYYTDDGTIYLWPERYAPEWYATMRRDMGHRYDGEMNGNPKKPGIIFNTFPRYSALPDGLPYWFTWLDPAWGRSTSSSYKCWLIVASDGHYFYVVDAYCRQGTAMQHVIDAWYQAFAELADAGLRHGGYEKTFAQDERFRQDLDLAEERHGQMLPVSAYDNTGDKDARIMSMESLFELERVLFPERPGDDIQELINQLKEYDPNIHDIPKDGPDALEACIKHVRKQISFGSVTYQSLGKRRYNRNRKRF